MTLAQERPAWIVFDAADTLLRAEPDVAAVYHEIAKRHGADIPAEVIEARFQPAVQKHFADELSDERRDRDRWQRLVFEIVESENAQIFTDLWDHFANPHHWRLFDDVAPTWNWLAAEGFQLAIASNFDARLKNIVAALAPIRSAKTVFISSELGFRKPSLRFFRSIERELGQPAGTLLMIGDSLTADFQAAKAAGWQALHLDRRGTSCPSSIRSLLDLRERLR